MVSLCLQMGFVLPHGLTHFHGLFSLIVNTTSWQAALSNWIRNDESWKFLRYLWYSVLWWGTASFITLSSSLSKCILLGRLKQSFHYSRECNIGDLALIDTCLKIAHVRSVTLMILHFIEMLHDSMHPWTVQCLSWKPVSCCRSGTIYIRLKSYIHIECSGQCPTLLHKCMYTPIQRVSLTFLWSCWDSKTCKNCNRTERVPMNREERLALQ